MTQNFIEVPHINGYLLVAPDIYVEPRATPFFRVPEMRKGSQPTDNGNLLLTPEERDELITKNPRAEKWIRPFVGSREFIRKIERYCLWLVDCPPDELRKMPLVYQRVKAVREFRLSSKKAATRQSADRPTQFQEIRQPTRDYILVPRHSSELRRYVPIGYVSSNVICGDANHMIPNAELFHFGVLTSSVHMTWMRTVCGRLTSRYRYSATIVYNCFPWPLYYPESFKPRVEATARKILDVRAKYPTASFADLYDEISMPADLRRAHAENDAAVMSLYPFRPDTPEEILQVRLLEMYEMLRQDFADAED